MNYVKHLDLFGVKAAQIPCITGSGAPTTATEGAVGCLYMDTSSETKDVYKCTAAADGVYTWELFETGGSGGGSSVELDTTLTQEGKAADAKAVGDVIEQITEVHIEPGTNLYNHDEWVSGKWVNTNGTEVTNAGFGHTGFIPVSPGDIVIMGNWNTALTTFTATIFPYVTAYDADKKVKSAAGVNGVYTTKSYTVPDGIYYLVLSLDLGGGFNVNSTRTAINCTTDGVPLPFELYKDSAETLYPYGYRETQAALARKAEIDDNISSADKTWSSKKLVDTFFPVTEQSGEVVTVEPASNSVVVTSILPDSSDGYTGLMMRTSGKNLFDMKPFTSDTDAVTVSFSEGVFTRNYKTKIYGGSLVSETDLTNLKGNFLIPGTYILSVEYLNRPANYTAAGNKILLRVTLADGSTVDITQGVAVALSQSGRITAIRSAVSFNSEAGESLSFKCQLEMGSASTEYEQGTVNEYSVDFGKTVYGGTYDWNSGKLLDESGAVHQFTSSEIVPINGINYFCANAGTISIGLKETTYSHVYDSGVSTKMPWSGRKTASEIDKGINKYIPKSPTNGYADIMVAGDQITLPNRTSVMHNTSLRFVAKIDSIADDFVLYVGIGAAKTSVYGEYIKITPTTIEFMSGGTGGGAINHNITEFKDYLFVSLSISDKQIATVKIVTNGADYSQGSISWLKTCGEIFAELVSGGTLSDCELTWNSADFSKHIWMYGDSYFSYWPAQLRALGYNTVLLNGYPGETAVGGLRDFKSCLEYGTPKFAVWCLGMNNHDTTTSINADWMTCTQEFIDICEEKKITPILATIPCVSAASYRNEHKNNWIRNSGYRYVDFARAVNGLVDGQGWYEGMLSSDNVHPATEGSKCLVARLLMDVPEIQHE